MWVIFKDLLGSAALVFKTLELDECKYNHTKKGYEIICYLRIYEYSFPNVVLQCNRRPRTLGP